MYNIVGKLVMETYKKHEIDANNVHMWGKENPNLLFYYQESGELVESLLVQMSYS